MYDFYKALIAKASQDAGKTVKVKKTVLKAMLHVVCSKIFPHQTPEIQAKINNSTVWFHYQKTCQTAICCL